MRRMKLPGLASPVINSNVILAVPKLLVMGFLTMWQWLNFLVAVPQVVAKGPGSSSLATAILQMACT